MTPTHYVLPRVGRVTTSQLRRLLEQRPDADRQSAARTILDHFRGDHPDWLRAMAEPSARELAERQRRERERVQAEIRRDHVVALTHRAVRKDLLDEDEAFELAREFADDPDGLREQLYGPQTAESDLAVREQIARDFQLDVDDVAPTRREWGRDHQRLLAEASPPADLAERQEIARTFGLDAEEVA